MHHQIRPDGGEYDLTAAQFRAELARLYREHYVPVRAEDLALGKLDVPPGKTPVVLTFDDSTKEQFAYLPDGTIKPDTAIGIMLAFAAKHPDFKPAGTFYVNREPFAGVREGPAMLRWLAAHGFEIGNHTKDHIPFHLLNPTQVQRQLVLGGRVITSAIPDAKVVTMALPLGVMPKPAVLARRGRWGGESYSFRGVFLVGANPAPSPYDRKFDPWAMRGAWAGIWNTWRAPAIQNPKSAPTCTSSIRVSPETAFLMKPPRNSVRRTGLPRSRRSTSIAPSST
jgi:peptidoglycan/xylan/chitin deacetylase (PgdA/CDA1 family)